MTCCALCRRWSPRRCTCRTTCLPSQASSPTCQACMAAHTAPPPRHPHPASLAPLCARALRAPLLATLRSRTLTKPLRWPPLPPLFLCVLPLKLVFMCFFSCSRRAQTHKFVDLYSLAPDGGTPTWRRALLTRHIHCTPSAACTQCAALMRAMATRSACERGVLPARALRAAFTWSLLLSAAAGNAPRGVPPSLAALYEASPEGRWKCFDSSAVLLASQVNDDFCDCADGSDEPGTPACGNAKFYCLNKGSKGKYLPSLAVNDGICDCCDGSDEYASKVTCPNVCDVEGSSMRAEQAERVRRVEEGVRARAAYAREARVAAEERERVRAATQQAITAAEGVKTKVQAVRAPRNESASPLPPSSASRFCARPLDSVLLTV
ncbi:hypothetical protein EON67_01565 [archaeon]|nr:MAG: hypothetical protein EON67_01565 [archaeon]